MAPALKLSSGNAHVPTRNFTGSCNMDSRKKVYNGVTHFNSLVKHHIQFVPVINNKSDLLHSRTSSNIRQMTTGKTDLCSKIALAL